MIEKNGTLHIPGEDRYSYRDKLRSGIATFQFPTDDYECCFDHSCGRLMNQSPFKGSVL